MQRILVGLLLIAAGIGMIVFARQLEEMFGPQEWMEKYLFGTSQGYVILGGGLVIIGWLMIFGVIPVWWSVSPQIEAVGK